MEDQETILTAARTRAEMGLAPTDEMELEWMKQCERAEEKARRELEAFEEVGDRTTNMQCTVQDGDICC